MRVMHLIVTCLVASMLGQLANAFYPQQQQPVQQAPAPAPAPAPGPAPVPGPVGPGVPPVGPGIVPGIPPVGPGIGMPPFLPPFGMLGPLGPLGFPFLGPLGVLGLGPIARLLLFGGKRKRSVEDEVNDDFVKCFISTKTKTIDCSTGTGQRVACEIEPRLGFDLKLNLTDLAITEKFTPTQGEIFSLLSPKSALYQTQHGQGLVGFLTPEMLTNGKFTFIDPSTRSPVLLSFYFDVTLDEPGFVVKDKVCYDGIVDIILPSIKDVRFNLVIA